MQDASTHSAELLIAQPSGICAGVERAIEIVERALAKFGAPIYVRHEIVHNTYVVTDLRARGVVFIDELDEVPPGATLIFSAHGVSKEIRAHAAGRGLKVFDATCPFVTKVHVEIAKLRRDGYEFIMVGHAGHPEVEGTMGQIPDGIHLVEDLQGALEVQVRQQERLAVVTQTTLSVDDTAEILAALKRRFPKLREPKKQDVCYATQNRQDAVRMLVPQTDLVIVVGSVTSSNSQRLHELAQRLGAPSHMIDGPDDLRAEWFTGASRVGLAAGASVTPGLLQKVVDRIRSLGVRAVRRLPGPSEDMVHFPMPRGLSQGAGDSIASPLLCERPKEVALPS